MRDLPHLDWPFFDDAHRDLAARLSEWAESRFGTRIGTPSKDEAPDQAALDAACRSLVAALGAAGLARCAVPATTSGAEPGFDVRSITLTRELLAWHDGLADFAFAMQGLGSGAISLAGSPELKTRYLPVVAAGRAIAAFALSEPTAGSDVAAMRTSARREGGDYRLDGTKTWISNGGIADFYCVFARTSPAELRADGSSSASGITAFVVDADAPGLEVVERIQVIAPHPLATLRFEDCRIPAAQRIGEEGEGFRIAMRTLDVFRTSVAGAALGFAQRALDEALRHVAARGMFGRQLADFQLTQATLAELATELEASRLLTYRAAWQRDRGGNVTKEAAMAKMSATESAQRIIDGAVQLFGGRGVASGETVERLYREIWALRIYEGATEVQKLIIGRELLKAARDGAQP